MSHKLRRLMAALFFKVNFFSVIIAAVFYASSSYVLLALVGEKELIALDQFFYWLVVTASTVGYGDLSPVTGLGKLIVSVWVIPFGLSLFAVVLTRVGLYLSEFYLKGKKGFRMINAEKHCVVIGWNGSRTLRLIELLLAKANATSEHVILCVEADMENPLPNRIDFVRVDSFSNRETMRRTNLQSANRVIIDTPRDDVTLTTALFCEKESPNSHKTVYFQDESVGELLLLHCPTIEIVPSVSVEMLARSSQDPGSAQVHQQLLDSTYGMTQYRLIYNGVDAMPFDRLFQHFKTNLNATLIGLRPEGAQKINLNPELQAVVSKNDSLYYIAAGRLAEAECFDI